jgi:hypothetical protein
MDALHTLHVTARKVTEIPFDKNWDDGSGYFDKACDFELEPGKAHYSVSNSGLQKNQGRLLVLIGSEVGTYVLFQRYNDSESVVTVQVPSKAKGSKYESLATNARRVSSEEIMNIYMTLTT